MMNADRTVFHFVRRFAVTVTGLLICSWLMWSAAQVGASRLFSKYGAGAGLIEPADRAVSISPADPESYAARATALLNAAAQQAILNTNEAAAAAGDYEQAIALRPRDYRLWMELGNARDQAGNLAGAITAFQEAIKLAPFYAHTHWQFGNLLLRASRYDEGLAELRHAATNQPSLMPQVIDLTWGIYQGDARTVEAVIQPQTAAARMTLATYFAQHGKADDAIRLFSESRKVSDAERRSLLTGLLASKQFPQAYKVWATFHEAAAKSRNHSAMIDGSFESEIGLDDPGFGWQINPNVQAVQLSLDAGEPSAGARSLLIKWDGDSPPAREVISQIVLVEPQKHYQISFDARSRNLVTAGSPVVTVMDAALIEANPTGVKLAQSSPLPQGTTGWQKFSFSFETSMTTRAVRIAIERQHCSMAICPIFGQTGFDNFALQ